MSTAAEWPNTTGFAPSPIGKKTPDQRARDAQKYLQVLADYRSPWEPIIDNLILYVNHGRRGIQDKDLWPGQATGLEIFADAAMRAKNMLVDGMTGYLCSRNQPWFALSIPGVLNFPRGSGMRHWSGKKVSDYPAVQKWLQDSQDVMYSAFNRSNFYDVITEFIGDGAVCGTAHLLAEEDIQASRIAFTVPHFRECYIEQNVFRQVDTNYRVYKLTLRRFVQQFGLERMKEIDEGFERDLESNQYAEREVLHAVYPRSDYDPSRIDAKGKRWESIWVYRKGGKILNSPSDGLSPGTNDGTYMLSEGGYDSMPSITWRWRVNTDEVYGRGPAHDAWIAIALDNQMGRTNIITGQKAAEPPLVAHTSQRGQIMRGPGAITFLEARPGTLSAMAPIPLNGNGVQQLPFSLEFQQKVEQSIMEHFHADTFMLLTQVMQEHGAGRPVTEQIFELQNEKAALLGTRVGRLQSEALDPIIDRVFDIENRAGRIPEPPDILLEGHHNGHEVEYLGMLAQAQTRLTDVRTLQAGMAFLGQMAQVDPYAVHVVDTDAATRLGLDKIGFPVAVMRSEQAVARMRIQAMQMQERQQQIENAPKIAKAAALAGKSAEPESPLRALMSGGGEQ